MRISDWSSDVCSSDLRLAHLDHRNKRAILLEGDEGPVRIVVSHDVHHQKLLLPDSDDGASPRRQPIASEERARRHAGGAAKGLVKPLRNTILRIIAAAASRAGSARYCQRAAGVGRPRTDRRQRWTR